MTTIRFARAIRFALTIDNPSQPFSTPSSKSPLEEAVWQLEYTQGQANELNRQLEATLENRSDLQDQVDDLEGQVAMLQEALDAQEQETVKARNQSAGEQSRGDGFKRQTVRWQQEAAKARMENVGLHTKVDDLNGLVQRERQEAARALSENADLQSKVYELTRRLEVGYQRAGSVGVMIKEAPVEAKADDYW